MYRLSFFKVIFLILVLQMHITAVAQDYVDKRLQIAAIELKNKNYAVALEAYLFDWNADPLNIKLLEPIAYCYFYLGDYDNTLIFLKRIETSNRWNDSLEIIYIKCLMANEKYNEAKQRMSPVIPTSAFPNLASHCDSAILWQQQCTSKAINLWNLNSEADDLAPTNYHGALVFSSNRTSIKIKQKSNQSGLPMHDLFISSQNLDKQWQSPQLFATQLNSSQNEASLCFSNNQDTVYFSRNNEREHKHLNLYQSSKKNLGWSKPKAFMMNDSSASFAHPSISADGKLFFFASNMKGGFGGTDIYVCILLDSSWSMPINLGNAVNTEKNEIYPYINKVGNLYFASEGRGGMGGYDLFTSLQKNGEWQEANNLKTPFNSGANDFGYSESVDGKIYFTSNRKGGKGGDDIYRYEHLK